jgi:hypothetical protein
MDDEGAGQPDEALVVRGLLLVPEAESAETVGHPLLHPLRPGPVHTAAAVMEQVPTARRRGIPVPDE